MIGQELGAAGKIGDGCLLNIEAEVVIEGGHDFHERNRAFGGVFPETIGCPDDLARTHSSAGH